MLIINVLTYSLNILTVNELYFFEVSKLVHRIHKGVAPAVFNNMLPYSSHQYHTRLRQNNAYSLAQPRTERGKRSLQYTGVLFWSQVPIEMKLFSIKMFKFYLKRYLTINGLPENL